MLRGGHKTRSDWIVMQIVQLLKHHLIGKHRLGMEALLPDLMGRGFVGCPVIAQLIEEPITPFFIKPLQNAPRREFFEISDDAA